MHGNDLLQDCNALKMQSLEGALIYRKKLLPKFEPLNSNYLKTFMMKYIVLILFLTYLVNTNSQILISEGIFSSGGYFKNSSAIIDWTLGDLQISTIKNKELIITQGFLQSQFKLVGINSIINSEYPELNVFPNPVVDLLNIEVKSDKNKKLLLELRNLEGKLLLKDNIISLEKSVINFRQLQSGIYILKVYSDDFKFSKDYKIIYQN